MTKEQILINRFLDATRTKDESVAKEYLEFHDWHLYNAWSDHEKSTDALSSYRFYR